MGRGVWDCYCSVYSAIPVSHCHTTETLASGKGHQKSRGDWKHYDEQFRLIGQWKPVPWDEVNTTLWSKALKRRPYHKQFPHAQALINNNQPAQPKSKVGRGLNHPRGACFRYHGGATCTVNNCTFDHKCYNCGQSHPAISCPSSSPKQQERQQSSSAKAN